MTLTPLTVRNATPAASVPIEADVTLELQDVAFGLSTENVPTGPQLWHVTNTGEQPRQMVLLRTPRAFTSDDFATFFQSMDAGTPSPDFMAMVGVAYTAVASPGYGTYVELDLDPGIYTATSWVIDPETQMPALLLGMNAMRAFDRISIDFQSKKVRFVLPGTSMLPSLRLAAAGGI